jgi:hypothetical protein
MLLLSLLLLSMLLLYTTYTTMPVLYIYIYITVHKHIVHTHIYTAGVSCITCFVLLHQYTYSILPLISQTTILWYIYKVRLVMELALSTVLIPGFLASSVMALT